jgi:hypothetical protein
MVAGCDDSALFQRDRFEWNQGHSSLGVGREFGGHTGEPNMTSIPLGTKRQRKRLVDEAMQAYVDWREECIAVWDAYGCWAAAGGTDAALAFVAYTAALDREERASEIYADLIRRVGDLVMAHREPATDLAASERRQQ